MIAEASTQIDLSQPGDGVNASWTDWNEYQLNWLPGQSEWFVNGLSRLNKTYGVPNIASSFQIKMWSDGSSWPGNMSVGGLATLDIEWIDMVYNTSVQPSGGSCKTVCNIDDVSNDPNPKPTSGSDTCLSIGVVTSMALWTFWVMVFNL